MHVGVHACELEWGWARLQRFTIVLVGILSSVGVGMLKGFWHFSRRSFLYSFQNDGGN